MDSRSDDEEMEMFPKKQTRVAWSTQDELNLLKAWEKYDTELRENKRNMHIYKRISKEIGGKFSVRQVHIKITNFIQKYRNEKKKFKDGPSTWEHFKQIHKIIGKYEALNKSSNEEISMLSSGSMSLKPCEVKLKSPFKLVSISKKDPLSSPLPQSPLSPLSSPVPSSSSTSSLPEEHKQGILKNINKLTEQSEKQLEILKNMAQNSRNLCVNFESFLKQHQENEKRFLELFTKLVEKD